MEFTGAPQLTEISPAKVWIGLKNSDDVGLRVDLLAEVFVNDTKVAEGQLNNVPTGSSGFNNALLNTVPLNLTPADVFSGAALNFKLSVRRTCFGGGHNSGTPRLWFNGQPIDSGSKRDAGSRFDATIRDVTNNYFLRNGFALSTTPDSSRLFVDVFIDNKAACPARPFKPFGTWIIAVP
jgi:hypothetical protein